MGAALWSFHLAHEHSRVRESRYLEVEIARRSRTVKDIEPRTLRLAERAKALLHKAAKDDGATFEQLGVDCLFDEAHHAKNLAISTRALAHRAVTALHSDSALPDGQHRP